MLNLSEEILKFLNGISQDIKMVQEQQARVASGKTARSLEAEADERSGVLYGSISVNALETGRKPGKRPPISAIRQWIEDKGIFTSESDSRKNGIAYVIAKKIGEEGTQLFREGGKSGVLSSVITDKRIDSFEREILRVFGREVVDEITTYTK